MTLPSVHRILLPLLLEMRGVPCSCLTLCVIALGTSVQKTGGKEWKKIGIVSTRVNGQFSIASCLILLASQMGREDKVSLKSLFLSKVGGRRGTMAGPFSTSPFRTVLAPFSAHGSPVDDSHSGSGSYTSRALLPFNCHPPVPLPHVSGITLSS